MDNCENCTAKGNFDKCVNTKCKHHDSWYVLHLLRQISDLNLQLNMANLTISKLTTPDTNTYYS